MQVFQKKESNKHLKSITSNESLKRALFIEKGGENLLTITDLQGNIEGLTGYKGLKRKRNANGEKTLSLIVIPAPNNEHSFHMVQEESVIEFQGDNYRIKQMSEKNRGAIVYKEVVCIHTLFDLIELYKYETHTGSMTFTSALNFVLGDTVYTWDISDTFYAQDWENLGNDNLLALFQSILKRYDAEFTLNGTRFTFKHKIGNATDFQFRYNYNIKTINRQVNTNNLSTYIKGFGKKNADGSYLIQSEYTSPNAAIFGIRHAKPVYDERYTTLEGLDERLAEIKDTPDVSVTIDFVDMRRAGYPFDVPNEGDDVFLIYEPMNNLDLEARLMEVDEEFEEGNPYPVKTAVTLSNYRKNMTDTFVEYSRTQKTVNDIVEGNKKLPYSVVDDVILRATEALQSAQTELEFENGIIARSKVNPNHLVLFNSSGVGVSTDGGQTFQTAMTAEGFVADLIAVGTMLADRIKGGTLTLGGLDNGNGKMTVLNEDGEVIADLDAARGGFDELFIGKAKSPSLINVNRENLVFYVDPINGNDLNDGKLWGSAKKTIQSCIDSIPKYNEATVKIWCHYDNSHNMYEQIRIKGFVGAGQIEIDAQAAYLNVLTGNVVVSACQNSVLIKNMTVNSVNGMGVEVYSSPYVYCGNVWVFGQNAGRCFNVEAGGQLYLESCQGWDASIICFARTFGRILINNVAGYGVGGYGIAAQMGGEIRLWGNDYPGGSLGSEYFDSGGNKIGTGTVNSGGKGTVPPVQGTKQISTSSANCYTLRYATWENDGACRQGTWAGSYGNYKGCWFFGTSILDTIGAGKTIKAMRVLVQRASTSGTSGAVRHSLRAHGHASNPGGEPMLSNEIGAAFLAWGQSAWINVDPYYWASFASGAYKGVGLFTSDGSNYSKCLANCTIEITYA
jgi:phage minor structural protein